jgi:catechol 2,3-dioxygenase-like lactoylglutathione lyase family enzyme
VRLEEEMHRFLTKAVFYLAASASLFAQGPAAASPVVGVGTFIHVVVNLDKTIRFYGDRLGLEMTGAPGPRAFSANAVVENLYDVRGSQSRVAVFRIAGSPLGVEFVEFKDASQKPFHPRIQDPGASLLTLPVPDVDALMTKLKEDGTPVISEDGKSRTAVVKDPDGFYIRLAGGAPGAVLSLTVDSTERTLHVFRDLLGFQPETGKSFVKNGDRLKALGLRNASYRSSTAKVPGTSFEVEFIEFKGIDRQTAAAGIHDPGAGVLRLVVSDVDGLLGTLRTAAIPVVSAGGETVSIGTRHVVILRDPDNFFFQIIAQANSAPNLTPATK